MQEFETTQFFGMALLFLANFETEDLEQTITAINASDVNRRWGEYMTPIMKIEIDSQKNFPFLLPLQWHMD